MDTLFITITENYHLSLFLFFLVVIITASLYGDYITKPIESVKAPILIFKSGRFIQRSLKKRNFDSYHSIECHLLDHYNSLNDIKAVILDEYDHLLVFTKESPNNPTVLEGEQLRWSTI